MSVTTTDNVITHSTILQTLGDYELHHSGGPSRAPPANLRSDVVEAAHTANPADWPTDHRRIPAYKPINRDLDRSQRPGGSNPVEQVFIYVMLHGVNNLAVRCPGIWGVGKESLTLW